MDSRDIGMIIMFIIIIYLFIKIQYPSTQENMTTADSSLVLSTVSNEINRIYNMDVEAIRNLGAISKSLLTGTNYHSTTVGTAGTLTIPADNTTLLGNANITGTLSVNGSILLPPGIIMAWYQATAPAGWGVCDGTLYGTIQSPDLRGRFIFGSATGFPLGRIGGEVTVTLQVWEIPAHNHIIPANTFLGAAVNGQTGRNHVTWDNWGYMGEPIAGSTLNKGGDVNGATNGHNNMPPYFVLVYIIKL